MVVELPILGAASYAGGTILERVVLKRKGISIKVYQIFEFSAIILALFPLIFFFWKLDSGAFELKNILIFALVIVFSLLGNFFTFYSVKREKITNLVPAKILEPLFTILLAIVFSFIFGELLYERNFKMIIPAVIASLALVFSHIEKSHLKFNNYFLAAIAGSFFFALELVTSRLILNFYSPITFYFLRCSIILLISFLAFGSELKKVKKLPYIVLLTGVMWVVYRFVVYYGYLTYGVIFTTLIITLGPVFVYLFSRLFLKEKIKLKNVIASIVIIACILYAILS